MNTILLQAHLASLVNVVKRDLLVNLEPAKRDPKEHPVMMQPEAAKDLLDPRDQPEFPVNPALKDHLELALLKDHPAHVECLEPQEILEPQVLQDCPDNLVQQLQPDLMLNIALALNVVELRFLAPSAIALQTRLGAWMRY